MDKYKMANRVVLLALVFGLITSCGSIAGQKGLEHNSNSEIAENKTRARAMNGFGALLLLTDDKKYMEKWNERTKGFHVEAVHSAIPMQPIFVLITIANPGVDKNGLCNVSADVTVHTPDGKLYGEIKDGDCWQNMPAPAMGNIQLSKFSMGIVIEEKDPSGRYVVDALIKDHVKKAEIRLTDHFDVR